MQEINNLQAPQSKPVDVSVSSEGKEELLRLWKEDMFHILYILYNCIGVQEVSIHMCRTVLSLLY